MFKEGCVLVLVLRFLCFYLSWQQDLVTQRVNPGICSHRHWDLAESMHGHLCTAATEAQGSLLLHPSSSGAKMDQPLVDPSQRKRDFSGKHTQSFQEAPVWVLQRTILFSLFFPDHPFLAPDLSMHSYMVRNMLVFGIQCSALEKLYTKLKGLVLFWIRTSGFSQCLIGNS